MFDQELECCGAEFEKSHISFVGLLTFSFPLLCSCFVLKLLISPIYFFRKVKLLDALIRANFKLISQKSIFLKLKCQLAASIFKIAPRLSGVFFKFFNFSILLFIWVGIIAIVNQVV